MFFLFLTDFVFMTLKENSTNRTDLKKYTENGDGPPVRQAVRWIAPDDEAISSSHIQRSL